MSMHNMTASAGQNARAEAAWVQALADADETSLVAASSDLDELGYATCAAESLIDASLIAARAGNGAAALVRAQARVDELGYRPFLGPIPEVRWLAPAIVSSR